jgi:hypothetical protein
VRVKLLFFNIGWMERYQGLHAGDGIVGGGSYVKSTAGVASLLYIPANPPKPFVIRCQVQLPLDLRDPGARLAR